MTDLEILKEVHSLQIPRQAEDFTQPVPFASRLADFIAGSTASIAWGLDVNSNQDGEIKDPNLTYAAGYRFVILEATWGLRAMPTFSKFWPKFLDAGFIVLVYGFMQGNLSGADQAELLLETARPCYDAQGLWMPAGFDVEPFNGDVSTLSQRQRCIIDWATVIRTVVHPKTYSNIPSWQKLTNNMPLPEYILEWSAHWANTLNPLVPTGWPRRPPEFHQDGVANLSPNPYSWIGKVPGISGDVSRDKFYGSMDDLRALGTPISAPPTEPPVYDLQPVVDAIENQTEVLLDELVSQTAQLASIKGLLENGGGGGGTTPPPSTTWRHVNVIRSQGHANAYFIDDYNHPDPPKEPKPIMAIWPSNGSDPGERIQFESKNNPFDVYKDRTLADGGSYYWRIAEHEYAGKGDNLPALFFHPNHVAEAS